MNYTGIGDAIPQLADLSFSPPYVRPINLGGQNFTHCCLLAVNRSVEIQDGNLVFTNYSAFKPDLAIDVLQNAIQVSTRNLTPSFTAYIEA
jgi:hypothetical protein